jgi:hypothetical protein
MKHNSAFNTVPLKGTFVILFTGSFLVENKLIKNGMRFEVHPEVIKTDVLLFDFVCLMEVYQQFSGNLCLHIQGRSKDIEGLPPKF